MKLKNHFIICIIVLLLSISFVASPLTVSANSYNKAYVTKDITVYRFIAGNCFANSRLGSSLRLNKWKTITIKPFYHMGKDGYFLHVAGHGSTIYYARTNSTHWFKMGTFSLNSATPQAFKTVSDNSFDFNKYVPGFLTAGNVATVYTTVNDAATQTGKAYTLKSIYKKMLVKRNCKRHP